MTRAAAPCTRADILDAAKACITVDRAATHGAAEDSFAWIAGHYAQPRNRLFEEVACLVIATGLLGAGFQRLGRLDEDAVFRTLPGAYHDCRRCRQPQRAGAGNHQHRNTDGDGKRRSLPHQQPDDGCLLIRYGL